MASTSDNPDAPEPQALPTPEELSEVITGYEVIAFLAQGGMGAIYRGEQTRLERPVAIKFLPRSYGADFDYAERFEREAKAMAKLSHNNIVSVFDYGETGDCEYLYFVMEFIEGSNLHQLLLNGPLEVDQAVTVLRQVCAGLQYAHEHGIIHRDIKPSNILVDQRGTVKMADFGLAKIARDRTGAPVADADDDGDTVMGTPDYIAPEALIEGVEIDYRADIFSVGVLTYELLTGKLPRGPFPEPSKARVGVDRRFDDIVRKAMNPDRDSRYQRISEIDRVLAEIGKAPKLITGKGKPQRKSKVPRPPRAPVGGKTLPAPPGGKSKVAGGSPIKKPGGGGAIKKPAAKRKIAIPAAQADPPKVQPKSEPVVQPTAQPSDPQPEAQLKPQPKAEPGQPVTVTPKTGTGSKVRTRTQARHRQAPQKTPTSAMIAIGVGFLVLILIGVLMMWFKSRSEKPEENDPSTVPPPPGEKKDDGSFFGVPVSIGNTPDGIFPAQMPSGRVTDISA